MVFSACLIAVGITAGEHLPFNAELFLPGDLRPKLSPTFEFWAATGFWGETLPRATAQMEPQPSVVLLSRGDE
jgi:hypothetical protein